MDRGGPIHICTAALRSLNPIFLNSKIRACNMWNKLFLFMLSVAPYSLTPPLFAPMAQWSVTPVQRSYTLVMNSNGSNWGVRLARHNARLGWGEGTVEQRGQGVRATTGLACGKNCVVAFFNSCLTHNPLLLGFPCLNMNKCAETAHFQVVGSTCICHNYLIWEIQGLINSQNLFLCIILPES